LKWLVFVDLMNTSVTDAGLAGLKQALSNGKVRRR
jgi:hypothetical protein